MNNTTQFQQLTLRVSSSFEGGSVRTEVERRSVELNQELTNEFLTELAEQTSGAWDVHSVELVDSYTSHFNS